ncbi:hypothetical protein ACOMHN_012520 [Nucella lapillus]
MMEMYFVTKVKFSNLLFHGLNIDNTAEMVGACILTFLAAMACEALKVLKTYVGLRMHENPLAAVQNPHSEPSEGDTINANSSQDETVLLSSLRFPASVRQIQARRLLLHGLSTLNHTLNFFWGYILMLLVMSYSVWLTIAVVSGCGAGYFIFAVFGERLQRKYSQQPIPFGTSRSDTNQLCHAGETVHM